MTGLSFRSFSMVAFVVTLCASPRLRAVQPPMAAELAGKLREVRKFTGTEDPKTTLEEVLQRLERSLNITIVLNDKAFPAKEAHDAMKTLVADSSAIPPFTGTLTQMLDKIFARVPCLAGAVYIARPSHIEVTTHAAVVREFYPDRPKRSFLPPLVNASVANLPLVVAVHDLARDCQANIVVDVRAQKEAQNLVTAGFSNVPLDTATRILADMAGLTMVEVGNVLYVTTRDNGRALQQEQERCGKKGPKKAGPSK